MECSKTFRFNRKDARWTYILWIFCFDLARCQLQVKIADGILEGRVLRSRNGRPYHSYTGVPYAKPPVGELRFEAPEPTAPWNGTLDATGEPKQCVQNRAAIVGQEDCLYLNVYSPVVDKKSLLPIMFWIHGGGFVAGNGGPGLYGPEYFMDKDVVLVSINYRLGVFGYLSTEDDAIPGNYGMKDQVMALRWVQRNIARFNGDPDRVTIFGGSAGGASAGFHLLSPMSKGLFHKAILQSGTPVCSWATPSPGFARRNAHAMATMAGCNSIETSKDILKCLKNLSADFLGPLSRKLNPWPEYVSVIKMYPVVENCDGGGEDAFLCNHPVYDLKQESFVPVIIGLNSAEGGMFASPLYNCTALTHTGLRRDFSRVMSILNLYYQHTRFEDLDEIGDLVLKEYFPTGTVDDDSYPNMAKAIGDCSFIECSMRMAERLSSPVYGYFYDYQNEFSTNNPSTSCENRTGSNHGDELISLFKSSDLYSKNLNADDLEVSKLLVDVWCRFASSEFPTVDGTDGGAVWPQLDSNKNPLFLHIDSARPKIIKSPFEKAYQFWSRIYSHFGRGAPQRSPEMKTEL